MRPTAFVLALAALAGASSAAAQPRDPQTVEEGAELDHYLEGEESPRLEALRLDELRLFRRQQALVEAPAVTYGLPDALGSDVPPDERVARGAPLPWLEGLNLPDLPVRFHEQVVEYLEYFKQNRRGRVRLLGRCLRQHRDVHGRAPRAARHFELQRSRRRGFAGGNQGRRRCGCPTASFRVEFMDG